MDIQEFNSKKFMEHTPTFLATMAEAMQALGRADMECLKLVDFTGVHTAIDLGGSLGWQAREIRRLHPNVEKVIVAELDNVVQVAANLPENVAAGIEYMPVDFRASTLPPADAYILGHVIHCYREPEVRELLHKVHEALPAGGLLVVLEQTLNADKLGPMTSIHLDLIMIFNTVGQERTVAEYQHLIESEGFTGFQFHPVKGSYTFEVIVARKA